MTENMKEFLKEVENNAELKARLSALPDEEASKKKVVEIAKEYGFTLTAEDCEVGNARIFQMMSLKPLQEEAVFLVGWRMAADVFSLALEEPN